MATFPRFVTVGFVGARRLAADATSVDDVSRAAALRARLDAILAQLESERSAGEFLVAVSPLAAGGDTVFAEAVAARGIAHQIFLPQPPDQFFNAKDFFDEPKRLKRAQEIMAGANVLEVRVASDAPDRHARFSECGFKIALESDVLFAVVRPEEIKKPGGTRETLEFARMLGLRIFEIELRDDLPVTETPAQRPAETPAEREIFHWPLGNFDYPPDPLSAVAALKAAGSARSRRQQRFFREATAAVTLTHIAATAAAVWAAMQLWGGEQVAKSEALLLALGLVVYAYLHWRHPQRRWVAGRLVAELAKSTMSLRGLAGPPAYLGEFHLPGCGGLVRSLRIIHLQAAKKESLPRGDLAARYLERRLDNQATWYGRRAASARFWRTVLSSVFITFSVLAFVAAVYAGWHWQHGQPESEHMSDRDRFWFKFLPIALPLLAAGAASWGSLLDLDRRAERFEGMVVYLKQQRGRIEQAARISHEAGDVILARLIHRTEQALLQEVVEWHAKHAHVKGH